MLLSIPSARAFLLPHYFPVKGSRSFTTGPRAITPHRQGINGIHRTILAQRLQNRFDEAVAGVAGQAFAVGAEVGEFAAAVPDGDGRAGGDLGGAGEDVEGFQATEGVGQLALAAGFLHGEELHALGAVVFEQFGEVLLVADVARAGRVPEVHDADRAGAGEVVGQAQRIAGKYGGVLAEGAQVAALEPVVGRPQHAGADQCDQGGKQCRAGVGAHVKASLAVA